MEDFLWLVAELIAFFLLVPYVVGPPIVRLAVKQPLEPELRALDQQSEPLAPNVQEFLRRCHADLRTVGYELRDKLLCWTAGNVVHWILPFQRPGSSAVLIAFATSAKTLGAAIQATTLEVVTVLEDGTEISTLTSDRFDLHDPVPAPKRFQFFLPKGTDGARLVRAHEALVRRHETGSPHRQPNPDTAALLVEAIRKTNRRQVERGYFFEDARAKAVRPTLKGATILTWRMAFPVGRLRAMAKERGARALAEELRRQGVL